MNSWASHVLLASSCAGLAGSRDAARTEDDPTGASDVPAPGAADLDQHARRYQRRTRKQVVQAAAQYSEPETATEQEQLKQEKND